MEKLTDIVKRAPAPKLNMDVNKTVSDITENTKNTGKKLAGVAKNTFSKTKEFFSSKSPFAYIVIGLLFIILILLVVYLTQNLINLAYSNFAKKTVLLDGIKDATNSMVISQDPDLNDSITIPRSENEDGGIEFTYSFWLYVSDWMSSTPNEEKHVFHKGEKEGKVNFAPKVTLDGGENKMYIYMNTFNTQEVKIEIDNLPVKKWFNVCMTIKHKVIDIYINGFLKKTYTFDSIPRQNYRNIYINQNKGFTGYLSSLVYYKYALNYFDIQNILNNGPSTKIASSVSDTFNQIPPYFSSNWWNE
jgi:hypothetical protein